MTAALRFTRQARSDLIDIWRAIARHDDIAANRIVDRDGRVLVLDRWLVFYRTRTEGVLVVRVLDGRRDLPSLLPRP